MKVRLDYVSNSSSSSFMVYGSKFVGTLSPEDFDKLGPDEAYFVVCRNRGSEGDYIFPITPTIMMDCDMHQIELSSDIFDIFKAKYIGGECSLTTGAAEAGKMAKRYEKSLLDDDDWDYDDAEHERLRDKTRKGGGLPLDGLKLFDFDLDYGSPKHKNEIMEELENSMESHKDYKDNWE